MPNLARYAIVPLTLAAAAAPAVAQADAGHGVAQSAALLGTVGNVKLYPLAGSQLDPFSNLIDATVAGVPLNSVGVSQVFSDGLPVRDLPAYSAVMKADDEAQATGNALMMTDGDAATAAMAH